MRILFLALLLEKVIQHLFVSWALFADYGDIRSSIAYDYRYFLAAGLALALLFSIAFYAKLKRKKWSDALIICLAITDIIGEFIAQGTLFVAVNVSFIIAVALLMLTFLQKTEKALR